jgi:hypothetical protein
MATNPTRGEYVSNFDAEWDRINQPRSNPAALMLARGAHARRGDRGPAGLAALVVTCDGARAVHCLAVEVSTSGVLLNVRRAFAAGTPVRLWLALGNRVLKLSGRAVRNVEENQAFEFVDINDIERLALAEFLDRTLGMQPHPRAEARRSAA